MASYSYAQEASLTTPSSSQPVKSVPVQTASTPSVTSVAPAKSELPYQVTSLSKQMIKERMKSERETRRNQMPYLDRGLVAEMVNPRTVEQKMQFTANSRPKSLDDVIHRAVETHTPAKAAREKMALARRKILVALRNLFPEAKYELIDKEGGPISQDGFQSGSYRVSFRQPLFHGGMLWNTFLQGKAELEASENEYDSKLGELVKDVSRAYFDFNRTKNTLQDHLDAAEKIKKFKSISEEKYKSKIISEIEHLNAQSLFGQVQFEIQTARQEYELAKLELQKFLNLLPTDQLDIKPLYDAQKLFALQDKMNQLSSPADLEEQGIFGFSTKAPAMKVDELVDMAYQFRPELRMESAKLEAARLSQKIKWGKFMPQADITLEFGRLAEELNQNIMNFDPKKEFRLMFEVSWNAGGNKVGYTYDNDQRAPSVTQFNQDSGLQQITNKFSVGLLDGLNDFVDAKDAEVKKLEQVIELEKAEKQVMQDVKAAYFDYQKNLIQVKSVLQKANYRKRLVDLSKHRLDQNEIQVSEYVQAEIDYLEELSKLHTALKDLLSARSGLNYAIGVPDYLSFGEGYGARRA